MSASRQSALSQRNSTLVDRLRSHPVFSYFCLTFSISWTGAFLLVAPRIFRGESIPKFTGLMMFPVMLLGPLVAGLAMTAVTGGTSALRDLGARLRRLRFPLRWYAPLLIPPLLIVSVLYLLAAAVSPVFRPNHFVIGVGFGVIAGFVEEIGWTGFAFPAMDQRDKPFAAAVLLGLLWSLWHAPVIDYLGTATPHRSWWLPYFLAFAAVMTAMRVLIAWLYTNTRSVLLAQFMHASSTGALVVLSPPAVSAGQETFWYLVYAAALWMLIAFLRQKQKGSSRSRSLPDLGSALTRPPSPESLRAARSASPPDRCGPRSRGPANPEP